MTQALSRVRESACICRQELPVYQELEEGTSSSWLARSSAMLLALQPMLPSNHVFRFGGAGLGFGVEGLEHLEQLVGQVQGDDAGAAAHAAQAVRLQVWGCRSRVWG